MGCLQRDGPRLRSQRSWSCIRLLRSFVSCVSPFQQSFSLCASSKDSVKGKGKGYRLSLVDGTYVVRVSSYLYLRLRIIQEKIKSMRWIIIRVKTGQKIKNFIYSIKIIPDPQVYYIHTSRYLTANACIIYI